MIVRNIIFLAIVFLPVTSNAQLSFFGYLKQTNTLDSSVTYRDQRFGNVSLERSEITITPRGSYLDIVEDAWLSGNTEYNYFNLNQIPNHYFIRGTIQIPQRSVLAGLLVWDDTTVYRAKLYTSEGGIFPNNYSDTTALQNEINNNLGLIEKTGLSTYQLTLQKTEIGEVKHVRIRYLMANQMGGIADFSVPVIFSHGYGPKPKRIKLSVTSKSTEQPFVLNSKELQLHLENNVVNYIPFSSPLHLISTSKIPTTMHMTTFANGPWNGNYLLFNTSLPDSVLGLLSQPIQTVFLWRWNTPQAFTDTYNQSRSISGWGHQAIAQAASLQSVLNALGNQGHSSGLVHSIEGKSPVSFSVDKKSAPSYKAMQEYLGTINENYILTNYGQGSSTKPAWAPEEVKRQTIKNNSKEEFLQCLSIAHGLYTDSTGTLRHLVILSAGPAKNQPDKIEGLQLDTLFAGLSTDISQAQWSGVNFSLRSNQSKTANVYYNGFYFPEFTPKTVSVSLKNEKELLTFPVTTQSTQSFSCIAKSSTPWDSLITWRGFNKTGDLTGTVSVVCPSVRREILDSGLVKLWAGDEDRLSERFETSLGSTYGIVTKEYSLRAGISDTTSISDDGIYFLSDDEIFKPVATIQDKIAIKRVKFTYTCKHGILTLLAGKDQILQKLQIYDALGHLLVTLDLKNYLRNGRCTVHLNDFPQLRSNQLLVVHISGKNISKSFTLVNGGRI